MRVRVRVRVRGAGRVLYVSRRCEGGAARQADSSRSISRSSGVAGARSPRNVVRVEYGWQMR